MPPILMKKIRLAAAALCTIAFVSASHAASIVTVSLTCGIELGNVNGAILSGGTAADGNGDVLQFGYFSGGTLGNPFAGTWVPLTGAGGANSAFGTTSIGDTTAGGAGDGQ